MGKYSERTYLIVKKCNKDTRVHYVENGKRAGTKSAERYEKYCKAKTIGEALELGSRMEDLVNDIEHKLLKVIRSHTQAESDDEESLLPKSASNDKSSVERMLSRIRGPKKF